jgi:hypothetical protein
MKRTLLALGLFCLISAPIYSQTSTTGTEIERTSKSENKANSKAVSPTSTNTAVPENLKQVDFTVTATGAIVSHQLPVGFPQLIDTGDAVADEADYKVRKQQWIAANPAKYQQFVGTSSSAVSTATRTPEKISNK